MQLDHEIAELHLQQRAILRILESIGANVSVSAIDKKTWVHILRSCGLTDEDMTHWHAQFEHDAPDAHHAFLFWLGITQDEALKIRRRAKHKTGKKR